MMYQHGVLEANKSMRSRFFNPRASLPTKEAAGGMSSMHSSGEVDGWCANGTHLFTRIEMWRIKIRRNIANHLMSDYDVYSRESLKNI